MFKIRFFIVLILASLVFQGCVSLTYQEKRNLVMLKTKGITVNKPAGDFEEPNSRLAAGLLNILPGFGNFYLAVGQGNDPVQCVYGLVNVFFWPFSVVWAAPQGAIDAGTLNGREMLYYYRYDQSGKQALKDLGIELE